MADDFSNAPSAKLPELLGVVIGEGRKRLTRIIGRGAWGIVYLGEDVKDPNKKFAAKCISSDPASSRSKRDLAREVNLHNVCSKASTHILALHEVINDDESGLIFLITDYFPDGDLLEFILADKFIGNDGLIRSVFLQILDAVEACHKVNIFHRDLKPENVLCKTEGPNMHVVLTDFGFATTDRLSKEFCMGSEPFMSPEVRGGLQVRIPRYSSQQADLWALGVILMNLVCGCLPWNKASLSDPHFSTYIFRDRDYIYHNFPISQEVNNILKCIFTTDVRTRISIAGLRKMIKIVPSFGDPGRQMRPTMFFSERYITDEGFLNSDSSESTAYSFGSDEFPHPNQCAPHNSVSRTADPERLSTLVDAPELGGRRAVSAESLSSDIIERLIDEAFTGAPEEAALTRRTLTDEIRRLRITPSNDEQESEITEGGDFHDDELDSRALAEASNIGLAPDDGQDADDEDADVLITPETRAADAAPGVAGPNGVPLEDVPDLDSLDNHLSTNGGPLYSLKAIVQRVTVGGRGKAKEVPTNVADDLRITAGPEPKRIIRNAARMMRNPLWKTKVA